MGIQGNNPHFFLSLSLIMRIYNNVYDCAIYLKLLVFFACFKHTVKIYDQCINTLIIIKRFYHKNIYNKKFIKMFYQYSIKNLFLCIV